MFGKIKLVAYVAIAGFVGYSVFFGDQSEQTADLGQVLDRTDYALTSYQGYLGENEIKEVSEDQMGEFIDFYTEILNSETRFYETTLGVSVLADATFLGFADTNANKIQDEGEGKVFTVEIDEEKNRLIATDVAGNSSGLRFSGTGFLAGALMGNLLGRQRGAGVTRSSFSKRNVSPRSSYKAPSSARSGGPRSGK